MVLIPATHPAEMEPFNALMGRVPRPLLRGHRSRLRHCGDGRPWQPRRPSGAQPQGAVHPEDSGFIYEPLGEPSAQLYGRETGSHYQAQALKLSKHFR